MSPATDTPEVSVLILAYQRRDEVDNTLTKLRDALEHPQRGIEIIVCDNASTDGTAEMVAERHPGVRVIRSPENIGAPALNLGFAQGRGDWFLILDDDCYIEGDALVRALAAGREHDADLISFAVVSGKDRGYRFDRDYQLGLLGFWGCAFLISRRAYEQVGGYDPEIFIWGNEPELTLRTLNAGFRHLYFPSVVAIHMKAPPDPGQPTMSRTMNLRHFTHTATKHFPARQLVPALSSLIARGMLGGLARGEVRESAVALREGVCSGLRHRAPARPEIAALYQRNFAEFVSPTRFTGGVRGLLRRGDREAEHEALRRAFWAERPALYPDAEASLRV
ncbi:MAG TPA: glycosyltransferase [Solirubrobacteraceae bacterium]|jgi:GT2 family glycosyltransferase